MNRYWYDPDTGLIIHRTLAKNGMVFNLPYFDKDITGFNWSSYKVDIETGEIVPIENTYGSGIPRHQR